MVVHDFGRGRDSLAGRPARRLREGRGVTPFVSDPDFTLYVGDVRDVLAQLPDGSVDCVATSPPFYALRDYGVDGQIGLEATPELWVDELVGVFREARRVLSDTGTLWVECGDSYCANQGQVREGGERIATKKDGAWQTAAWSGGTQSPMKHPTKPKDLLGQPWMLAFALRADGWWLRQAIIWHKPNAMPESATDRCTTAHSYVFLLSKSARYHFDAEAIGEEFSPNTNSRGKGIGVKMAREERSGTATAGRNNASFGRATQGDLAPHLTRVPQTETLDGSEGEAPRGPDGRRATHVKQGDNSLQHRDGDRWPNEQRHPRSVWTIPTQGYNEAHFATWPEAFVERIVKAGCPEGGTVLDPFMGSGTTALVARRLGRKSIGIELNPEYAQLAARRLQQLSLLAEDVA
jgi:DNA modification methylase